MKKTCFVIMGFGRKMDYRNSQTVDLDIVYNEVIKKLFEKEYSDYKLIRADTLNSPGMIEDNMYKLLLQADLVIADITTLNENAIYELGIRYAVRPRSTIVMKQKSKDSFIPFDLNHCNIYCYQNFGITISNSDAEEIQANLKEFIDNSQLVSVDSPFYKLLKNVSPPKIDEKSLKQAVNQMKNNQNSISSIKATAEKSMKNSDFSTAISNWSLLKETHDPYVIQQLALATYKYKQPNETLALENALGIIKELDPENSLDLETLGITGAIYKKLYFINNRNFDYLEEALKLYRKGYIIKSDYYNGENYANCLILKSQNNSLQKDEKDFIYLQSANIYKEIINDSKDSDNKNYWKFATLSLAYGCLEDKEKSQSYYKQFKDKTRTEWERESFQTNYDLIIPLMDKLRANYKG